MLLPGNGPYYIQQTKYTPDQKTFPFISKKRPISQLHKWQVKQSKNQYQSKICTVMDESNC